MTSLAQLETEFSLLIKALNVLQKMQSASDSGSGSSLLIVNFFESLRNLIRRLPPLSLSAYWANSSERCFVGRPASADDEKPLVPRTSDDQHDPMKIVQFLCDHAKNTLVGSRMTEEERSVLISFLLAMGVKSGRATIMLDVVLLTLIDQYAENDVPMDLLSDLIRFVDELPAPVPGGQVRYTTKKTINMRLEVNDKPTSHYLFSFGKPDHGKLGHGEAQIQRTLPTVVAALRGVDVVKVASMSTYAIAIDSKGSTYVWGTGGSAGSNHGHRTDLEPQVLEALPQKLAIVDISCGLGHTMFLTSTGRIYSWGNGGNGRLGVGDNLDRAEATLLTQFNAVAGAAPPHIKAVQCGACHSLALTDSGTVYVWGKNSQGQCGLGHLDDVSRPTLVTALVSETIVQITAGWEHSVARTDIGALYSWGSGYKDNRRGLVPPVLGLGTNEGRQLPELIASLHGITITYVACGWDHCLALDDKGCCYSWGSGQNGKLGHGNDENVAVPLLISAFENMCRVRLISAGCEHSAAIGLDGLVYTWGQGDGGRLGRGDCESINVPKPVIGLPTADSVEFSHVYCGDKFTMLLVSVNNPIGNISSSSTTSSISREPWLSLIDEDENIVGAKEINIGNIHTNISSAVSMFKKLGTEEVVNVTRRQVGLALTYLMCKASTAGKNERSPIITNRISRKYCTECSPYVFSCLLHLLHKLSNTITIASHSGDSGTGNSSTVVETYDSLLLVLNILRANFDGIDGSLECFKVKSVSVMDEAVKVEAQDVDISLVKNQLPSTATVIENPVQLLPIDSDAVSPTILGTMSTSGGELKTDDFNLYSRDADLTFTEDENKLETSIDDFAIQSAITSEIDGREFTTLDSESFARALSGVVNEQNDVAAVGNNSASSTADLPGPRRETNSASRNNRTAITPVAAIENTDDINEHEQSGLFSGVVETDVLEASADFEIETSFTSASVNDSDLSFHTAFTGLQSPNERFQHISGGIENARELNNTLSSSPPLAGGGRFITFAATDNSEDFDAKSDDVDDINTSDLQYGEDSSDLFREGVASLAMSENEDDIDDYLDPFFGHEGSIENDFDFDVQQVILESIREVSIPLSEYVDIFPQKVLTDDDVRQVFFQLKVSLSELAGITFNPTSDVSKNQYFVWKEIQDNLKVGFPVFFGESEHMELLSSLIRSPMEFVHIFPGLVRGLLHNCKSDISFLVNFNFDSEASDFPACINLRDVTTFFVFLRSYVCEDGTRSQLQSDMNLDIQHSLLLIVAAILKYLYRNIDNLISDAASLDALFDLILTTTLESMRFGLTSDNVQDFGRSYFIRFLAVLISIFTSLLPEDKVYPLCSVIFLPFLKTIIVRTLGILKTTTNVHPDIIERVTACIHDLVIVCTRLLIRLGCTGMHLSETVPNHVDWTELARSLESSHFLQYRKLFVVSTQFPFRKDFGAQLSVLDFSLVELVAGLKRDRINFLDNRAFHSDPRLVKVFSVLVNTVVCSEFVVTLQSKNLDSVIPLDCRIDDKSKDIFALINSSLKGNGFEDLRELFYELYICFLNSLSIDIKNVDEPDYYVNLVNCLLQTYEIIALTIFFMSQNVGIDIQTEFLSYHIGLLFGRVRSVSSIGLRPFTLSFDVSLDCVRNSSGLASLLLRSYNGKKSVFSQTVQEAINDHVMVNTLKMFHVDTVAQESVEIERWALLVSLLKSYVPILPIGTSIMNEALCLTSLSSFFEWIALLIHNIQSDHIEALAKTFQRYIDLQTSGGDTNQKLPTFESSPVVVETIESNLLVFDENLVSRGSSEYATLLLQLLLDVLFLMRRYVKIKNSFLVKLKFPAFCVRQFVTNFSHERLQDERSYKSAISGLKFINKIFELQVSYKNIIALNQEEYGRLSNICACVIKEVKKQTQFQRQNILSIISDKSTFLNADFIKLNTSSVKIIPNVFTLCGDFRLCFWIYLPLTTSVDSFDMLGKSIHLISRVQESGDFNLNTLVATNDLYADDNQLDPLRLKFPCDCNPSVRLNINHNGEATIVVFISALEGILSVRSPTLPRGQWLKCSLTSKIQPPAVESPPSSPILNSNPGSPKNDLSKTQSDMCVVELNVASVGSTQTEGRLSRSSTHQNMIVGNVPSMLEVGYENLLNTTDHGEQLNGLFIADITWSCNPNLSLATSLSADGIENIKTHQNLVPPSIDSHRTSAILQVAANVLDFCAHIIDVSVCGISVISSVIDLALILVVLGREDQQSLSFQILRNILLTGDLGGTGIAGGSGLNAAVASKTTFAASSLINTIFGLFNQVLSSNVDILHSLLQCSEDKIMSIWSLRLSIQRTGVSKSLNVGKRSGLMDAVHENSVLSGLGAILCLREAKQQLQSDWFMEFSSQSKAEYPLCVLYCEGGWPVGLHSGAVVDLPVNTPFYCLQLKQKLQNQLVPSRQAFSSTSVATGAPSCSQELLRTSRSPNTLPGLKLFLSEGSFASLEDENSKKFVVPSAYTSVQTGTTEIVQVQDPFPYGERFDVDRVMKIPPINEIMHYLHGVVSFKINDDGLSSSNNDAKSLGGQSYQQLLVHAEQFCKNTFDASQAMMHIRALLVQLERAEVLMDPDVTSLLSLLLDVHMPVLIPLAAKDPVTLISAVFEAVASKSAQLDVLKNLFKEDDVFFLEKLVLRTWNQLHLSRMNNAFLSSAQHISLHPYVSPLAGEVSIVDNKIKAVSHFPSLRLNDVSLQRMSGRWFYEVTILTNGLMQIGWADNHFRCDPGCGQGVGDHLHSWAFDGLRMKRWSVSCEAYGKKWKDGDVLGLLVDMDLLEMIFYLNGESLGPAFEGFHCSGLFPAMSLNMRQSVRVNFGMLKFIYPPDEIDGLPFRPVCEAMSSNKRGQRGAPISSLTSTDVAVGPLNSKFVSGNSPDDGVAVVENSDESILNESVDIPRRYDENNGPTGMSPVRGLSIRNLGRDEEDSECGGSEDDEDLGDDDDDDQEDDEHREPPWPADMRGEEDGDDDDEQENDGDGGRQSDIRRQILVENLIGMGFPIDWALRACENCDSSVNESAAIAWIIERMELEQAKMEGYSANSSRDADEFDEGGADGTIAIGGSSNIGGATSNNGGNVFSSTAASIRERLNRIDSQDIRQHLSPDGTISQEQNISTLASDAAATAAAAGLASALARASFSGAGSGLVSDGNILPSGLLATRADGFSDTNRRFDAVSTSSGAVTYDASLQTNSWFDDNLTEVSWNMEPLPPPLLHNRENKLRRRHELDKQEVLSQISELDACEMAPITMSCQLALCILYARKLVVRTIVLSLRRRSHAESIRSLPPSLPVEALVHVLKEFFRQTSVCASCSNSLFPFPILYRVTSDSYGSGGKINPTPLVPFVVPFVSHHALVFHDLLTRYERSGASCLTGTWSVEETPYSAQIAITEIIKTAISTYDVVAVAEEKGSLSSTFRQLEDQTLRGFGVFLDSKSQESSGSLLFGHSEDLPPRIKKSDTFADVLVTDALEIFSQALSQVHDRSDWLTGDHDKDINAQTDPTTSANGKKINLLWAFVVLRTVITLTSDINGPTTAKIVTTLLSCCLSNNSSVRFCVFELLTIYNNRIIVGGALPEGLDALVKHKKLLAELGDRVKSEIANSSRRSVTKYTHSLFLFMRTWTRACAASQQILSSPVLGGSYTYTQKAIMDDLHSAASVESAPVGLKINRISSNAIVVSWLLSAEHSKMGSGGGLSNGLKLTLRALSNFKGFEYSAPIIHNLSTYGCHKFDNLRPGTLFEIAITKGSTDVTAPLDIALYSVFVTTEPEEIMRMNAENVPSNLKISNTGLTVRNIQSKKWSTVRCLTKLSGGLNFWEVRIDRCVSKNIFIGVVTEGAKMDNYVGCDLNGWAFLANKAIWHNKSKLKAYGELFRAGDIISVYLDLVLGNLSFAINGKSLGIAADGLTGEFYPAFSLYNEDDQITLLPPRSLSDCKPSPVLSWSSSSIEMLFDRYEALVGVLRLLFGSYDNSEAGSSKQNTNADAIVKAKDWEVSVTEKELLHRYNMWVGGRGCVRTASVLGEIVTIVVSPQRCADICAPPLRTLLPGVSVIWENGRFCELVGYGSHRLWFQSHVTGELFSCCEEKAKQVLHDKVYPSESPWEDLFKDSGIQQIDLVALRSALVAPRSGSWSLERDLALVRCIEKISGSASRHPSLLSAQSVLAHITGTDPLRGAQPHSLCDRDLLVRISLLLMLNDLVQALLPVLSGPSTALETEIYSLLTTNRGLIFLQSKLGAPTLNSHPTTTMATIEGSASTLPQSSSPIGDIELRSEEDVLAQIVAETDASARSLLFTDRRWRLMSGLQATVSVQLMRHLESVLEAETVSLDTIERALCCCRRSGPYCSHLSPAHASVQGGLLPLVLFHMDGTTVQGSQALVTFLKRAASEVDRFLAVVEEHLLGPADRAETSMLLTFFQAAGLTCALALNNNMHFPAHFSEEFVQVLVGASSASSDKSGSVAVPSFMVLCAHAFRRGLIVAFPESVLALLTPEDLTTLLNLEQSSHSIAQFNGVK